MLAVRTILESSIGKRSTYQGTFIRYGFYKVQNKKIKTVLLTDVKEVSTGNIVCSHVWTMYNSSFCKASPLKFDTLQFRATAESYLKTGLGYKAVGFIPPKISDIKLVLVRKVRNISKGDKPF